MIPSATTGALTADDVGPQLVEGATSACEKRYPGRVWQWLQPTRTAVCWAGMGMGLGGWYQTAMPSTACGRERPYTAPVTDLVTWIPLDENVQRHLSGYCGSP